MLSSLCSSPCYSVSSILLACFSDEACHACGRDLSLDQMIITNRFASDDPEVAMEEEDENIASSSTGGNKQVSLNTEFKMPIDSKAHNEEA